MEKPPNYLSIEESLSQPTLSPEEAKDWLKQKGFDLKKKDWQPGMSVLVIFSERLRNISRINKEQPELFIPNFALLEGVKHVSGFNHNGIEESEIRINLGDSKIYSLVAISKDSQRSILIKSARETAGQKVFQIEPQDTFILSKGDIAKVKEMFGIV
jgi:hypothetical protein